MPQSSEKTTARRNRAKAVIKSHPDRLKVLASQLSDARQSVSVGGGGKKSAQSRVERLTTRRGQLNRELAAARRHG